MANKHWRWRYNRHSTRIKVMIETPCMFLSEPMQKHLQQEIQHPNKQWVFAILRRESEQASIKLDTPDYMLLPDTQTIYRRGVEDCVNWMSIMKDPALRNIRDLRAKHIPLLLEMKQACFAAIKKENPNIREDELMVYANYPPSVQTLHFHFCSPYIFPWSFDAFRIHPLDAIVNNLRLKPDYYLVSDLTISLHENSPLYRIYHPDPPIDELLPPKATRLVVPVDQDLDSG